MKNLKTYAAPIVEVALMKVEEGIAASFQGSTTDPMDYYELHEE